MHTSSLLYCSTPRRARRSMFKGHDVRFGRSFSPSRFVRSVPARTYKETPCGVTTNKQPMLGFEPRTPALRKRCSTVELHRRTKTSIVSALRPSVKAVFAKIRVPAARVLDPPKVHDRRTSLISYLRRPYATANRETPTPENKSVCHGLQEQLRGCPLREPHVCTASTKGRKAKQLCRASFHRDMKDAFPSGPSRASISATFLAQPPDSLLALHASKLMTRAILCRRCESP